MNFTCAASLIGILMTSAVIAAPTITGVTAQQRYPWNGKVDITYTISGDIAAMAKEQGLLTSLKVTATDRVANKTYTASSLSGDTGLGNGTHKCVWDMGAQGLAFVSTNVVFSVSCETTPALYCVIDLSGGTNAASYPVTYLASPPSGGFNVAMYKTTKLVLKRIEPGTFTMCEEYQTTLTKPFYIGVFEMTQKQYQLVTGCTPSYFSGDKLPVEQISYAKIRGSSSGADWPSSSAVDSSSFMGKLRERTGLNFDLPTEAQHEYASLSGAEGLYRYCDSTYMWYHNNSSSKTHEVGTKEPNAWGLYDMYGNVGELCLDWKGNLSNPQTDPKGASSGVGRIYRGGTFQTQLNYFSLRTSADPSYSSGLVGFRLAKELTSHVAPILGSSTPITVGSPDPPVISPESGVVSWPLSVTMSCATEGAVIRYTTDGTEPTAESPVYQRFRISEKTTVKAIAVKDGVSSAVAVAEYASGLCSNPVVTAAAAFTGSKTSVALSCPQDGAVIRYTLDGSSPNAGSAVYSAPFFVTNSCTVKAYATYPDYFDSEVVAFSIEKVWGIGDTMGDPDQVFATGGDAGFVRVTDATAPLGEAMKSGAITHNQTSTMMTTATGGGTVSFQWRTSCEKDDEDLFQWDHAEFEVDGVVVARLDGVTEWQTVSQTLAGDGPHTLVWRYVKDEVNSAGDDCCHVADYRWTPTGPAMPVISPANGVVTAWPVTVTISCATEGAVIHYTTDGTTPTVDSPTYRRFRISEPTTVKAVAVKDGRVSEVAVAEYAMGRCANPVVTAASSFIGSKTSVTLSCATEGAAIRYTLDGSTPDAASAVYSASFDVTNSCTVKAYATYPDYFDSEVVAFSIEKVWGIGDTLGAPDQAFTTGGDAGFVRVADATAPLGESMKSGAITHNQTSTLSTTVSGPGTVSFQWKASCEDSSGEYDWDHAEFWVDSTRIAQLDGETAWQTVAQSVSGDGEHTLLWRYVKDYEESEGEDCCWVADFCWMSAVSETQTTDVPVPYDWLRDYFPETPDEYNSYEAAANADAANGVNKVWECYVAGISPTNETQVFRTVISWENSEPKISWEPKLAADEEVKRVYTEIGKTNLNDNGWTDVSPANRDGMKFFKVKVEMRQ